MKNYPINGWHWKITQIVPVTENGPYEELEGEIFFGSFPQTNSIISRNGNSYRICSVQTHQGYNIIVRKI